MENFKFALSEHFNSDWKYQAKTDAFLEDFNFLSSSEDFTFHLTTMRALAISRIRDGFELDITSMPYFCIVYTEDGVCELTYDGFHYSLRKQSIVFLDMSREFSIRLSQSAQWSFSFLIIEGKDCPFFYRHFYQNKIAGFFLPPISNVPAKIHALYDLAQDSFSGASRPFIVHKLLTDIMTALITEQGINPITNEMLPNHIVKALAYIDIHYTECFTLDDIASFLNVSKYSLSHDFKKHVGKSIMDFVCDKRMAKARELLSTTWEGIGEIGYQLGFSSDAHFISVFKKRVGITPLQYRKQHNIHSYSHLLND